MMMFKRFSVLIVAGLFAASAVVGQQSSGQSKDEMSIEESYLREAVEIMIINEASRSSSRDQKMIALDHIGQALDRGSTNEEIRKALEYLSLEGSQNKTTDGKRLLNDYPDVRRQAAKYLAVVNTAEAKNALIKICTSDNETSVIQEAIKSLGIIGMNENNDAGAAIVFVLKKDVSSNKPDSMLAIAAIETLEKLAEKNKTVDVETIQLLGRMMEGPYHKPIKDRAKQAYNNMIKYVGR